MNSNVIFQISTAVLALILAAVLIMIFVVPGDEFHTTLNDDVKDSTAFELVDDYTGSSFEGSVLVSHTGSKTELTIVAHIDITQKDEGPAFIFFDDNLDVKNVMTDYNGSTSASYIMYNHGKLLHFLQIGSLHPQAYDKGSGELLVQVVMSDVDPIPSEVSLTLAIGSKINDDGSYQNCLTTKDLTIKIWSE
jgi:hypothetical protein